MWESDGLSDDGEELFLFFFLFIFLSSEYFVSLPLILNPRFNCKFYDILLSMSF